MHKLVAAGRVAMAAAALVAKEAHDGEHFVWMTTWQIQPGTLADFERGLAAGHPSRGDVARLRLLV